MRKEHLKTAVVIGLATSVVVAGAYLLMPDKYKDKLRDKVLGMFKKKKKVEEEKISLTGEDITQYKKPDLNPALKINIK